MNAAKHIEYMDRAMNAGAMSAPYAMRGVVDESGVTLNAKLAQQYKAGVARGWRDARRMIAGHGFVLVVFGFCVGVTLAVAFAPMVAFMLGAGA